MNKINVIGTTGSGKSTFSKALAKQLDYPYIEMDLLFWKANWEESTNDEFFSKIREATSTDNWVLDGNYTRSNDIKWENADTIIWIDYSYTRTFLQIFKRTIKRMISQQELWPDTGNKETFRKSFLSKDSILIWFFKSHKKNKLRYATLIKSPKLKHINFVRLQSPKEAQLFIKRVKS